MKKVKVLFVCMGNICRSPTAHGVFRHMLVEEGLIHQVEVDSAGTHAYHVGESPDRRSQSAAWERSIDLSDLSARKVQGADFVEFDFIVAMDHDNLSNLRASCPAEHQHKLHLMLDFSPDAEGQDVPDPYYGGPMGFQRVLDLVTDGSRGLLARVRSTLEQT
ncbi:MAG: low molecular weight phosphotyrosine protein phosphatase [Chromatiales bacterium]|nr:low molecular weight phosphotyrosine protein phosphatase [Chromatiales bacterium]